MKPQWPSTDISPAARLWCYSAPRVRSRLRLDEALHFTALDHIETSAPDSAKTAAFYARLFGAPVWKNNKTARRYVMLGSRYIAIEHARQPFGVDHFSVGIEGFVVADIHAWLKQRVSPTAITPAAKT